MWSTMAAGWQLIDARTRVVITSLDFHVGELS
jgi:hypothetical protein